MNAFENLAYLRSVHAGTTRKAARVWSLLNALSERRVFVPAATALNVAAEAIYYKLDDADERYCSIESFKEDLVEDLDERWPKEVIAEVPHYVLRPFFAEDSGYFIHLDMSYLRGALSLKELSGLNVLARASSPAPHIVGLPEEEAEMLAKVYHGKTVALVNLMRKLSTGLCYISSALKPRPHRANDLYSAALKDGGIEELVAGLVAETTMPLMPAPARHFGTEADRTNPLRALPEERGALDFLLED